MEKEWQTQINPGMSKLHLYIAYRRVMALNIDQLREVVLARCWIICRPTRCERGQ
jgi:hypothetical protein